MIIVIYRVTYGFADRKIGTIKYGNISRQCLNLITCRHGNPHEHMPHLVK